MLFLCNVLSFIMFLEWFGIFNWGNYRVFFRFVINKWRLFNLPHVQPRGNIQYVKYLCNELTQSLLYRLMNSDFWLSWGFYWYKRTLFGKIYLMSLLRFEKFYCDFEKVWLCDWFKNLEIKTIGNGNNKYEVEGC